MGFSITRLIVDGSDMVVAMDWQYSNADGTLSRNQDEPALWHGTSDQSCYLKALGWLNEQLQNTAEEFDAAIAKAEVEYVQSLSAYETHRVTAPTKIVPENQSPRRCLHQNPR